MADDDKNKFTIKCNDTDGVLAVREKISVDVNAEEKKVHLHDFTYSVDEIIAIANKLEAMGLKSDLTFS